MRTTVVQAIVLLNIAVVLGFAVNALRGKGSIDPTRRYAPRERAGSPAQPANPARSAQVSPQNDDRGSDSPRPDTDHGVASSPTSTGAHGDRPIVTFDQVRAVVEDPSRFGLDVIIDARDDEHYRNGHIPGAYQFFPYSPDYYTNAIEAAMAAERVIVYCNGGDCEDSHMACDELEVRGILREVLYLYTGGWEEWEAEGMPIEKAEG